MFCLCKWVIWDLVFLQGFRSSPSSANLRVGRDIQMVEAKYPALLFKQQLTAYVETIYGIVRDNFKKDLSPLLSSCIQVNWPWFFICESCHDIFNVPFVFPISKWPNPFHFFNDSKCYHNLCCNFCWKLTRIKWFNAWSWNLILVLTIDFDEVLSSIEFLYIYIYCLISLPFSFQFSFIIRSVNLSFLLHWVYLMQIFEDLCYNFQMF
jgi:hypothetical protein